MIISLYVDDFRIAYACNSRLRQTGASRNTWSGAFERLQFTVPLYREHKNTAQKPLHQRASKGWLAPSPETNCLKHQYLPSFIQLGNEQNSRK